MWRHVSEAALADLLEGTAPASVRGHVDSCERCGRRLLEARAGLELAQGAAVPEPPALYWAAFPRQVDRRLAEERPRATLLVRPALAALALLVALVGALSLRQPRETLPEPKLPAWSALPPLAEDASFRILQGLEAAEEDLIVASDPRGVSSLVVGLSDAESLDLAEALEHELQGRKS